MNVDTMRKATFIESPTGEFYRVDFFDEDENTLHFHDEDTGDEHRGGVEALKGWTAYRLEAIKE